MAFTPRQRMTVTHSPFTVEQDGIHVACDAVGKLTFKRIVSEDEEEVIDKIPASLIFKIHSMLVATRSFKPFKKDSND